MVDIMNEFSVNEQDRKLLEDNGWKVCQGHDHFGVVNQNTDCRIDGTYAINFVRDKLEELSGKEFPIWIPSDEDLFRINGYSVICESPLEVVDSFGFKATGECALWLRNEFREKHKRSRGVY